MNLKPALKSMKSTLVKHSPEILTGLGIAGMITTTVLAVRSTPKAIKLCESLRSETVYEQDREPTRLEYFKATWKCYIPSAAIGLASVGCLIGANSENLRRNAALATAYAISESAFKEYKDKVVKEIGEKKEQAVRDAIAKDHMDRNPIDTSQVIVTGKGKTLCFDKLSGRYFESDIEKIKKAENEINRQMRYDNYVSLNEFYYLLGLDEIRIGDDIGWNIDSGYVDLDFSSHLDPNGTPCLVIDYKVAPRYEFQR